MCGISAIFSWSGPVELSMITAMTDMVRHRGPDDEGFACFNGPAMESTCLGGRDTPPDVYQSGHLYSPEQNNGPNALTNVNMALGHRRLSIIDPSTVGHQPMCSADGRYWIVHNGEVYNYIELRQELESLGCRFQSRTDTEVILYAYRCWGADCLRRFNGMFAFVLFDRVERKIFAARDRFGIKPLYYWRSPDGFLALASEIKQFSVLKGWKPQLNRQRACEFLAYGMLDQSEETLFEGVYQLRGGHSLVVHSTDSAVTINQWYNLQGKCHPETMDFETARDRFLDIFTDAVRIRLRSDVKVGSCLSGGLDSSSIVCVVNRLLREQHICGKQETVSSCFDIRTCDEREYIDEVIRKTGAKSHKVFPAYDHLFGELDRMVWYQDEPFGSTSVFAQWSVFRTAKQHDITVMLDGQGADELLAGYPLFYGPYFLNLLKRARIRQFKQEIDAFKKLHHYSNAHVAKLLLSSALPDSIAKAGMAMMNRVITTWINYPHEMTYCGLWQNYSGTIKEKSIFQVVHAYLPTLLHYEDRNSMAHSTESRLPFLDYRLVEFLLDLPDDHKIRNGRNKCVLREAMQGLIPDKVRTRYDKMGFVTPEEIWMKDHRDEFREEIAAAVALSDGFVRAGFLKYFEDIADGRKAFDFAPWRVIAFGRWLKRYGIGI